MSSSHAPSGFRKNAEKRRCLRDAGVACFLAALALRAAWVLSQWCGGGAAMEFDDERLHWELATNLVQRGALVSDDGRYAARMPAYPAFLALFAWMGSSGVLVARMAQAFLGAVTVLIVHRFARASIGPAAALVAAILAALDPYAIFFCNLLLTETPFTLMIVSLAAATWHISADGGSARQFNVLRRGALWLAALGTLAIFTRPSSTGWIIMLWALVLLCGHFRALAIARVATCIGVLAVCMGGWGFRNARLLGEPCWLSANGGVTLYDAQGPQADGSSNQSFLLAMPELARMNEPQRDRRLRELAIRQMADDPWRVLELATVKILRTWNPVPNFEGHRSTPKSLASAAFTVPILAAALLSLLGARKRPILMAVVWSPVVYFTLVHSIYIGSLRYRVPLMPMLAISAAALVSPRAESRAEPDAPRS